MQCRCFAITSNAAVHAVREVNEIFKDLSLIVSQQGEQVRRYHACVCVRACVCVCVRVFLCLAANTGSR